MRYLVTTILLVLMGGWVNAQTSTNNFSFLDYQKTFPHVSDVLRSKEDTLRKQFEEKHLPWPAKFIYLRSFKYDSQLEVWVKYSMDDKYRYFKTYKVCAMAGTLGPKRMQGDYQVPEGFYYINEFNPKSNYHLALGLNYPNESDRILSDSLQPGGDIYIHGSCVTTGCIPIRDEQIEELYVLATHAKSEGQDFIPVHIFPIQFNNPRSAGYLARFLKDFPEYGPLERQMKRVYDYFDETHRLPLILVDKKGDYVIDGAELPKADEKIAMHPKPKPEIPFDESELARVVDKLPVYPGGNTEFQAFIDKVSRAMAGYLADGQTKSYVMVEFIIDKDGKTPYARVIKGGNEVINAKLKECFENMPRWKPAVRLDKVVAVKLKQSLTIEKTES